VPEPAPEPEPVPESEPVPDPEPAPAAEEPPASLLLEPLWGFTCNKSKRKGKKAKVLFPPDLPSETDTPAPEASSSRREASPPCDENTSAPGLRYASLPLFKYPVPAEEAQVENTPCRSRGYHLASESRWIKCEKCRGELGELARKMARDCNPGWGFLT
jgi:hypothetical protein